MKAGKVTLVGAGPGDKGLLTLRGAEALATADVVLYDSLVGAEILNLIAPGAERIDVGKHAGNHPVPQADINRMLLEKAQAGQYVVRLKGGDPFVFGRGGEELELLAENGVDFEVVPGVTSAIAGPAYAGIPVTHRDYASSVHFITSQAKNNEKPNINFDALVAGGGTLVFLMGVDTLDAICKGLLEAGIDPDTPAAVVQSATLPNQRQFVGNVTNLPEVARANSVASPALIIVGKVCELANDYNWFTRRPLFGKRIAVPRVRSEESRLAAALRILGAQVDEISVATLKPIFGLSSQLEDALARIAEYDWLVFTSAYGVEVFFAALLGERDVRALGHLRFACVGAETTRALSAYGIYADFTPASYSGFDLATGLSALVAPGERVLIARARDGADQLIQVLQAAAIDFDDIAIYQRVTAQQESVEQSAQPEPGQQSMSASTVCTMTDETVEELAETAEEYTPASTSNNASLAADYDLFAFTSSSAVEGIAQLMPPEALGNIKAFCIGERTAQSASAFGMQVFTSEQASIDSLTQEIVRYIQNGD